MADLSSTRIFGKLTVLHDAILKANAEITGSLTVNGTAFAPVTLTGGGATSITGTYPDFTVSTPNYYLNGLTFDTGTGVLTAVMSGTTNKTIDLDGRYFLASDTTDALTEGVSNLFFTNARAIAAIQGDASWNAGNWDTAYGWGNHASAGYELASNKGVANGYAGLDSNGKVPSTQLPSFVDDVLEYSTQANFPVTGETGKIYVALDTNKTYRWSGSAYVYITSGAVDSVNGYTGVINLTSTDIAEGSNLYFTNARARSAIGVSGDLGYDSVNGIISFTETYSTASELLTALSTVDGNASGLDSDKVDGLHASQFVRSDAETTLNVGRGVVYVENHANDNQDGAGITIRTSVDPGSGTEAGGLVGSIFAVRSLGNAVRLWVGQSETSTGDNNFVTKAITATSITADGSGLTNLNPANLSAVLPSSKFDDTSHGNRAGGSLHAAATTTVDGFMSSTDKTKLDGITAGAEPNAVDSVNGFTGVVSLTASDVGALASGATAADSSALGGIAAANYLRTDVNETISKKLIQSGTVRNAGLYGTYDATKISQIYSMGSAYAVAADGTTFGTLYGAAYYHPNNGGGTFAGDHQLVWAQNGVPTAALGTNIWSSGNVIAYSDRRVKDNIEVIPKALEKVKKLNGYTFDRTDTDELKRQTGVIAQEVLEVLPEAVDGSEDTMYSVAYGNMVGLLIEAIKELSDKIESIGE